MRPSYEKLKMTEFHMTNQHAELLENRVRKNFRHLKKRMARRCVEAYRLYDWDVPEVRARVDYYAGHVVVAEYERDQTRELEGYLPALGRAAARAVDAADDHVHLKSRRTRPTHGMRYEKLGATGARMSVREGTLQFWVNLDDYLDTGLFADHRQTRAWLRSEVRGKRCLNLYAYTGAFTCAFAQGGARSTTSVDLSARYLEWTQDNLRLNGFDGEEHELVESDVGSFLREARQAERAWDVIFLDPPSFSTVGAARPESRGLDVQRDHAILVESARRCLKAGGLLVFSTNHQRFEPNFPPDFEVEEITHRTVPEDFRNRQVHRCFQLRG